MQQQTMNAVMVRGGRGPATALHLAEQPIPTPRDGEVLIRVRAAGVNRPDLLQREGHYPPPPGASAILGLEVAGEIVHAVGRWREGDQVCALLAGGGYAQYVCADARHVLPIPTGLDAVQAAALPETVFTVYANVFEHGGLKAGETLLVHGATSGIGVTAIQMARAAGARVISTSRGAAKAAAAADLGADLAIDSTVDDFGEVALAAGGIDVALDMVGAATLAGTLQAINHAGRIVYIAAQAGGTLQLPVWEVMRKQLQITGSTLRPRDADEKARLAAAIHARVWPWIESGRMRIPVARTLPLAEAAAAHQLLESGQHVGKVVLTVTAEN